MNVAELIAKLQEFDADIPVVIDVGEGNPHVDFVEVETVSRVSMYDDDNRFVVLNWIDANAA